MKRSAHFSHVVASVLLLAALAVLPACTPPPPLTSANSTYGYPATGDSATDDGPTDDGPLQPAIVDDLAPIEEPPAEQPPLQVAVADQAVAGTTYEIDPLDWPYLRGPEFNGISRETGLIDNWDPAGGEGSNVLWQRDDLGSRSTPIVLRGKLYTLCRYDRETANEGEMVICLDAATGKTIWEHRFNVYQSDVPDTRVGWSSVVGDATTGRVYALGVCGLFMCLDGDSGKVIWKHPLHEKFGLLSTFGGRTNSPVVLDDMVIISSVVIGWGEMAKPAHRFLAFDKATGEVIWFNGTRPLPYDTTYSSPSLAVLDGQLALVFGSGDGSVWALQPRTGNHIWHYRFSRAGLNASPLVAGSTVFASQSEENLEPSTAMGAVAAIDATGFGDITDKAKWKVEEIMAGRSAPLLIDGRLYVIDDRAKLHILDPKTGAPLFGKRPVGLGTKMRSNPLYADGKIYAITNNGRWCIMEPDDEKGVKFLNRGRLVNQDSSDGSPICSHGRIYIPTSGSLYCLEDPNQKHGHTERPPVLEERKVEDDPKAAHVQIVPAEALLRPGQTQKFSVRQFNSHGRLIGSAKAEFSVEGPGETDSDGNYTAPKDAVNADAYVTAKVGDLSGRARIRVIPPLPWKFDFEDVKIDPQTKKGQVSITWLGARYRHIVREEDGNKVMVKVTTIPLGTRSRCWLGHPDMSNYTLQADVYGSIGNNQPPDIGLMAQGYTLELRGNGQELEVRSWVTQDLMRKTVPFSWEPKKWYTMKLRAETADGKALLKGKVWPRGDEEPDQWSIEWEDASPQTTGSPGLFGNANNAEIFLDNIIVTSNEAPVSGE